jgi:Ca-activated chloride channel family protein
MKINVSIVIAAVLLCFGAQVRVSAQTSDEDVIRTESDLTNLLFSATDKNRRFITSLRQEDVRVLEDGVPQKLFTFQRETDRPLAVALLIDVSASEERTLSQEKGAARTFVETIIRSTKDQAAVIPFSGNAFLEQGLTRDVLSIYRALERVEAALPLYTGIGRPISGLPTGPGLAAPREGSTAIWDAVFLTARQILEPSQGQRRRAIVLLTDGQNTSGHLAMSAAIDQAIESETIVYAIGIGDRHYDGIDEGVLRTIAQRTGGRAFFPKKNVDLTSAFEEIEQELRSQYLVAYSSSNRKRDGKYRQLQIEISNPDLVKEQLKLRYRPGYIAKPFSGQSSP